MFDLGFLLFPLFVCFPPLCQNPVKSNPNSSLCLIANAGASLLHVTAMITTLGAVSSMVPVRSSKNAKLTDIMKYIVGIC